MDNEININEQLSIVKVNGIKEEVGEILHEYAREERRRGCKKGCCLLIFIITIIILYYGLDFYFSTS